MSLCERFGSKQRPLEPKQMNALKARRVQTCSDSKPGGMHSGSFWPQIEFCINSFIVSEDDLCV